ncbi:MAG: hypothetical protein ABIJ09_00770 [Pseudomonadota bacterium]
MPATDAIRQPTARRRMREQGARRAVTSPDLQAASSGARAGFGTYVLAMILIAASLVFYVFLRVSSLQLGYQLSQARTDQLKLVQENRALKTEIGTLSAPGRIRSLSTGTLGMVPAEHIIDLSEVR